MERFCNYFAVFKRVFMRKNICSFILFFMPISHLDSSFLCVHFIASSQEMKVPFIVGRDFIDVKNISCFVKKLAITLRFF